MVAIDRANGSCQRRRSAPRQHPRRCLRQEEIADAKSCLADRCARRHASLGRYSSEAIVAEGVMATSAQPKPTMTCRRIGGRSLLGARHSRAFSQQIMWGKGSKWREFSIFGVVKRPHDRRKGVIALTHHLDDCPSVGYTLQRAIRPSKQQTSWTNMRATSVPTHTIRTLPLPYRAPTPPWPSPLVALLRDGHDSGGRGGSGAGSDHFGRHLGSLRAARVRATRVDVARAAGAAAAATPPTAAPDAPADAVDGGRRGRISCAPVRGGEGTQRPLRALPPCDGREPQRGERRAPRDRAPRSAGEPARAAHRQTHLEEKALMDPKNVGWLRAGRENEPATR